MIVRSLSPFAGRMARLALSLALLALVVSSPGSAHAAEAEETLYQVATLDALLAGGYDGYLTLSELLEHGDLGLGTFDRLDGEMAVLDGHVYQVRGDGSVREAKPEETTPFAAVTFFQADEIYEFENVTGIKDLEHRLTERLPSPNMLYALHVRLDGERVKTRSVPAQEKPYPLLVDVVKTQPVFEIAPAKGDLVGFWCPAWLKGLNAPGLHIHFLDAARERGGHVLDVTAAKLIVEVDVTPALYADFPDAQPFLGADLDAEREAQAKAVER